MQIHVTPRSDSSLPNRLADAEIHFDEGPLAGLRLIGFTIENGDKPGERVVKLPGRVYTVAGDRRELALIQPLNATTSEKLEQAILDAHAETLKNTTTRTGRQEARNTPEVRKAVGDLMLKLGIVDTVLAVANECMSRAKDADKHPDPKLAAAWRRAGIHIGHVAHGLEGSVADYPQPEPKRN